tara:strand:+ start:18986 stop:19525 length:540 start_codon:yes stop_codon:yes gene_type:complete
MNNLYYELNYLKLSQKEIDELFNFSKQVRPQRKPHTHKDGWYNNQGKFVTSFDDFQFFILDNSHIEQAPFALKKIKYFLNKQEWTCALIWIAWIDGKLDWHQDIRNVSFSIPLVDIQEPIYWIDKDLKTILGQYSYKKGVPVIMNTSIHHGNLDNKFPRTMCQLSFSESFEEVKDWFII